jgi:cytochrome b
VASSSGTRRSIPFSRITPLPESELRDDSARAGVRAATESRRDPPRIPEGYRSVRIWDLPTRVFHWGIVVLIGTSWVTQHEEWMTLHFLAGYTMLAALTFRLVWGVIGSDTARFARFLRSPAAVIRHLRRILEQGPDTEVGHNATGGWMVVVLLVLLSVQAGTGLCANDQVSVQGPLADAVGSDTSDWLSHIHAVNFRLLEAVVVLHVLAIATYRLVKGHRLLRAMITGDKRLPERVTAPRMVSPALALLVFLAAAAAVGWWVRWVGS